MTSASNSMIEHAPARGLHRLVVLAVCLIWPLIWVGGLVTTYDAGMAVPDWPATYGDNMFLYPYQTWLAGPFDLFIEHGHRLLGALVGVVAIGIVVLAFLREPRRWVKGLSILLLVMVIAQGGLGGARVVLGDRTLAMIHGCFGPAFFAFCVATAVVTSRFWWKWTSVGDSNADEKSAPDGAFAVTSPTRGLVLLAIGLVAISYLQLVFGAMIRHVQPSASPGHFAGIVSTHILTAFLLWFLTPLAWWKVRKCGDLTLSRPAKWLIGLVGLQIALGIGTWVVNYGWPSFLQSVPTGESFVIRAKGFVDSLIVTGHVATGSLILAIATVLLVRCLRVRQAKRSETIATA